MTHEIKSLDRYFHVFTKKPKHLDVLAKQLSIDVETMQILVSMYLTLGKIEETEANTYKLNEWKYRPILTLPEPA